MKAIVFADDFTGALDTGVQFTQAGLKTEVMLWTDFQLSREQDHESEPGQNFQVPVQVTVVDTESRHIDWEKAYKRLFGLTKLARSRSYTHFYKKTDSTLRGVSGAEMQAMLDVLPYSTLHFLPAYPKMGRQTRDGCQYINGVSLDKTEFAADLLNPIHTAYIPDLLIDQGLNKNTKINCVKLTNMIDTLNNHPSSGDESAFSGDEFASSSHESAFSCDESASSSHDFASSCDESTSSSHEPVKKIQIYDAQESKTLEAASHALAAANQLSLTAGCAGFAEFLAQRLKSLFASAYDISDSAADKMSDNYSKAVNGCQSSGLCAFKSAKTLLLCGSASRTSLAQIQNYVNSHTRVSVHTLSREEKTPAFWLSDAGQKTVKDILRQVTQDAFYVIQTVKHKKDIDKTLSAETIAKAFGTLAKEIITSGETVNLIIFGGDTVYGVMNAIENSALRPIAEIAPGLVASELKVNSNRPALSLLFITKAGGLGGPQAINEMMTWIEKS